MDLLRQLFSIILLLSLDDLLRGKITEKDLPPVEQKSGMTQTEDILNSILPPREWNRALRSGRGRISKSAPAAPSVCHSAHFK